MSAGGICIECLCGFQVNREDKFGRLIDGDIRYLYSFENLVDFMSKAIRDVGSIRRIGPSVL